LVVPFGLWPSSVAAYVKHGIWPISGFKQHTSGTYISLSASSYTGSGFLSSSFSLFEVGRERREAELIENKFASVKISPFFRKA
jgi:hypothetical protein